jgi:hypothetical protein
MEMVSTPPIWLGISVMIRVLTSWAPGLPNPLI